jgi:hypothetical protein
MSAIEHLPLPPTLKASICAAAARRHTVLYVKFGYWAGY